MRILIGMETSGVAREAFRAHGHEVWSCDILPSDDGSPYHIQGDVFDLLARDQNWNLALFHPTCTYLTAAAEWAYADPDYVRWPGVGYHQRVRGGTLTSAARRDARDKALDDVRRLMALPFPHAIENPVGVISTRIREPDQIVQPHWFGDDASKATCLWLKRLPSLVKTRPVAPRMVNGKLRWGNQTDSGQNRLSPGPLRWKERSKTWPGFAAAMADQWAGKSASASLAA